MKSVLAVLVAASLSAVALGDEAEPQVKIRSDDPMTLLLRLGEPSGVETTQDFNEDHDRVGTGSSREVTISKQYREWEPVCGVPCGRRLTLKLPYRIGGDGISASNTFMLPVQDQVELRVHTGSSTLHTLGWIGIGAGIPLVLAGVAFLIVAPLNDHTSDTQARWNTAGEVTIPVGAILGALGVTGVLFGKTSVQIL